MKTSEKILTIACLCVSVIILAVFAFAMVDLATDDPTDSAPPPVAAPSAPTLPPTETTLSIATATTSQTAKSSVTTVNPTDTTVSGKPSSTTATTAKTTVKTTVKTTAPNKEGFVTAPAGYFKDALFIGDSRTVGIQEYASIEGATFFATTGMSVYSIYGETVEVNGLGSHTFESLIQAKQFGKIYVMLGINEIGYDRATTVARYEELIRTIQAFQPSAVVFIQANLHVTAARSSTDEYVNNPNLDAFNGEIAKLADGVRTFYIDVNPVFDDANGNLKDEYTDDNTHIYAKYYPQWKAFLESKAIVR